MILERLPQEAEEHVRQGWVITLGRQGSEQAQAALRRLQRTDLSSLVRAAARRALPDKASTRSMMSAVWKTLKPPRSED